MFVLLFAYHKMMFAFLFIILLPCLHMFVLLVLDFIVTIVFGHQRVQQQVQQLEEQQ